MLSTAQKKHFDTYGFLVFDGLIDTDTLNAIRAEYAELVNDLHPGWYQDGLVEILPEGLGYRDKLDRGYPNQLDVHQSLTICLPHGGVRGDELRAHVVAADRHRNKGVTLAEADDTTMATVWVAITDATLENGCLQVARTGPTDTGEGMRGGDLPSTDPAFLASQHLQRISVVLRFALQCHRSTNGAQPISENCCTSIGDTRHRHHRLAHLAANVGRCARAA